MQLHGFLYLYILFGRRHIDFFGGITCSEKKFDAVPFSRAGPVNAITWKFFSPVSRVPGIAIPGWPGCHVIAKLIFVAFNRRGDISANLAIPANRASPAHVIRPLGYG